MRLVHLSTFCVQVNDVDSLFDIVEFFEKKNVWIAIIPVDLVLDYEILENWIRMNLLDFENNENRAKKPNMNFLLRVTGKTQIREALKLVSFEKGDRVFLVVFAEIFDKEKCDAIYEKLRARGIQVFNIKFSPNLERILRTFDIPESLVDDFASLYESRNKAIKRFIIENSALAFLE